jgi:NADPH:quinone reductase-like Zn-dependent oxidoreductase
MTCSPASSVVWAGSPSTCACRQAALAPVPAGLTYEQAAALPQAGAIALQGIRGTGRVRPGHKVLINGGGGSGMYAVQLARLDGAEVTGAGNAEKLEFLRSLGADHVIDYAREDFTRNGRGYDLILDLAARRPASAYRRSLLPGGRYLHVGGSVATLAQALTIGPVTGRAGRKKIRLLAVRLGVQHLDPLVELIRAGKITTVIDRRFALSEVPPGAALSRRRARQRQGRHHRRVASGVAAPGPSAGPATPRQPAPHNSRCGMRQRYSRRSPTRLRYGRQDGHSVSCRTGRSVCRYAVGGWPNLPMSGSL